MDESQLLAVAIAVAFIIPQTGLLIEQNVENGETKVPILSENCKTAKNENENDRKCCRKYIVYI